jgi:hypothetical protein
MQRDPVGYADATNLYEYSFSSPNNYLDPIGLTVEVSSRVEWEYLWREITTSTWKWVGDTVVNTDLEVTQTKVTHISSTKMTSPTSEFKDSWQFGKTFVFFDAIGTHNDVKCPCLYEPKGTEELWDGVKLFHLHTAKRGAQLELEEITIELEAGAEFGKEKGPKAKVGGKVGFKIKVTDSGQHAEVQFKARVCPDGKGGVNIDEKTVDPIPLGYLRPQKTEGIELGHKSARGHASE